MTLDSISLGSFNIPWLMGRVIIRVCVSSLFGDMLILGLMMGWDANPKSVQACSHVCVRNLLWRKPNMDSGDENLQGWTKSKWDDDTVTGLVRTGKLCTDLKQRKKKCFKCYLRGFLLLGCVDFIGKRHTRHLCGLSSSFKSGNVWQYVWTNIIHSKVGLQTSIRVRGFVKQVQRGQNQKKMGMA